ncbi:MAG TPA: discoidin domain-containing protein [Glycomyces sp.]|nr:discoidin domain-containing protein [Glycomyces sp.]
MLRIGVRGGSEAHVMSMRTRPVKAVLLRYSSAWATKALAAAVAAVLLLAGSAASAKPTPSQEGDPVPVGQTWLDTDGDPIQAHGGGFLEYDGWYYWVGENKRHNSALFLAVSLYRSQDLANWEFVGDLLTQDTPGVCDTGTYEGTACKIERPKLVHNEATDQFVLWGHWETAENYAASHLIVATSDTIDGDYGIVRNFRPGVGEVATEHADPTYPGTDGKWGYGSRDFTVFQDPDSGEAFLVSSQDHLSMRVYPLTADFTDVDWRNSYPLFENRRREAPALAKIDGEYVIITSAQSGWYPNQAMYATTGDIADPGGWSELTPVGNNTTYYSQPTNIMTIEGGDGTSQYLYMGDRWNPGALGSSTYVWLPLEVSESGLAMGFHPEWSFDSSTGTIVVPDVELVSEGRPVTAASSDAAYPPGAGNDGIAYNLNTRGDNTNYYRPPGVPFTWAVDLGRPRDLSRVDLSWRSYNGSETYSRYTVSASVDGETWVQSADRSDNTTVGFTTDALTGHYRYVRIEVANVVNDHNGNGAAWAAGLVEVQVYANVPGHSDCPWHGEGHHGNH